MIKNLAPDTLFAMRDAELNALGYGVLITDAKGSIRFANDGFMALNGFERSELMNHSCRLLQGPLTDSSTLDAMRLAQDQGREFSADVLNYRKDGQPFWVSVNIYPLRNPNDVLTHFVAVVRRFDQCPVKPLDAASECTTDSGAPEDQRHT
jgi:PAS domain S-box-containing protein